MVNDAYSDEPNNEYYYKYFYNENTYKRETAISKIDEENLKKIASDLKIDYVQMSETSKIDYKLNDLKQKNLDSQTKEEKISSYKDIYYYFAIPLAILLIVDFVLKKRRMQWKEKY